MSILEDDVADHGLRMTTAELDRLCSDEQLQPITYNHYYADNVSRMPDKKACRGRPTCTRLRQKVDTALVDCERIVPAQPLLTAAIPPRGLGRRRFMVLMPLVVCVAGSRPSFQF